MTRAVAPFAPAPTGRWLRQGVVGVASLAGDGTAPAAGDGTTPTTGDGPGPGGASAALPTGLPPLAGAALLRRLADDLHGLSPQLAKAAAHLVRAGGLPRHCRITDFARATGTSPVTAVRLAKRYGFQGYYELRFAVLNDAAPASDLPVANPAAPLPVVAARTPPPVDRSRPEVGPGEREGEVGSKGVHTGAGPVRDERPSDGAAGDGVAGLLQALRRAGVAAHAAPAAPGSAVRQVVLTLDPAAPAHALVAALGLVEAAQAIAPRPHPAPVAGVARPG